MLGEESFSMKDMLDGLIKGEKVLSEDTVQEMVHSFLFSGLEKEKSLLIKILLLILLSAVLANFADVFESGQIGDICFYIVYLLLFILLMDSFSSVTRSVQQTITWMAEFMRGLAPAYFLTISIAAGSSTAAVFYEGVLILTWLIQEVILNLLFPGACLYVLISLINNLSKEEMLGKMAELLDTAVSWGLKTLLGMVVGLQVVRGLIAPVMDTLKRSALGKAAGALPGVGNAVNMVTELVLTSAVLVRNCLGVVILFAFVAAGAGPVIHYGILSLLYRFLAAIAQPVSEKRIVDSLATMGEGCALLLRILFTAEICYFDDRDWRKRMKEEIYRWVKTIAFFYIVFSAVLHLVPDVKYERYIRSFMGILLIYILSTPVFNLFGNGEKLLQEFRLNYQEELTALEEKNTENLQALYLQENYSRELQKEIRKNVRKME